MRSVERGLGDVASRALLIEFGLRRDAVGDEFFEALELRFGFIKVGLRRGDVGFEGAYVLGTGTGAYGGEVGFSFLKAAGHVVEAAPVIAGIDLREYGAGFDVARARGSQNNDSFTTREGRIVTESNRHGGMLGGISSGMPIVLRCAIKPTSRIAQELPTVDREGRATTLATMGRHDPCLLPRFVPMGEAMVALVLADHALRQEAIRSS